MCSWRTLLRHLIWFAFPFARAKAGNNKLAKMAMMAITTNNSMRVNACFGKILIWRCSFAASNSVLDEVVYPLDFSRKIIIKRLIMQRISSSGVTSASLSILNSAPQKLGTFVSLKSSVPSLLFTMYDELKM